MWLLSLIYVCTLLRTESNPAWRFLTIVLDLIPTGNGLRPSFAQPVVKVVYL
jgi:hypothetical protein